VAAGVALVIETILAATELKTTVRERTKAGLDGYGISDIVF